MKTLNSLLILLVTLTLAACGGQQHQGGADTNRNTSSGTPSPTGAPSSVNTGSAAPTTTSSGSGANP